MDREQIFRTIASRSAKRMRIPIERVKLETTLRVDLEMDSLEDVELAMELEEEFRIRIPDDAIVGIETVCDLVDYIETAVRAAKLGIPPVLTDNLAGPELANGQKTEELTRRRRGG